MFEDFNFEEGPGDLEFLSFDDDAEKYALEENMDWGDDNTSGLLYKDIYNILFLRDDNDGFEESFFVFYTPESSYDPLEIRDLMLKEEYITDHSLTSEEKLQMISDISTSDLSELLRDSGINASGKRKKLLKIASENISSISFANEYQITPKGEKFLKDFEWIDIYEDCLECFEFKDFYNYLNNLETDKSGVEIGLDYVDAHIQNAKKKENFIYLAICYVAQAFLYECSDYDKALNSRIKLFILSLNPIFDYDKIYEEYLLFESNVKEIRLLLKETHADLKPLFDADWDNQYCDNPFISKEDGFKLLDDLISGEKDVEDFTTEYYDTYLCEDLKDEKIISIREQLIEMVSSFCDTCLTDEYKELCIKLVKKVVKIEKNNIKTDKVNNWAGAVVYNIAKYNKILKKSEIVYTSIDEICDFFNAGKDDVLNKAEYIMTKFDRFDFDEEFTLFHINRQKEPVLEFDEYIDDSMDQFFNDAFVLADEGGLTQAMNMLDSIPEDSPEYGRALFFKSLMMSQHGNEEEALDFLQQSMEYEMQANPPEFIEDDVDLTNPQELYDEMMFSYEMDDFDRALWYCDALLDLEPDNEEVLYCKAFSLCGLDEMEEGLETIDKCIFMNPANEIYFNLKGSILSELGRFAESQECFDEALRLKPGNPAVLSNKAQSYFQSGDGDKVVEYYDKALEEDPSMLEAVLGKANYYMSIGDTESAQKAMEAADKVDKNDMDYLTTYGEIFFAQEKFDEAIECWDKCLDIDSEFVMAWVLKSFAYSALNDKKMFELCLSRASEIDPLILLALDEFLDELE